VEVGIRNEITLAQLVAAYINPFAEGKFDINTVFSWNLEEREDKTKKDRAKREVVQIPERTPPEFNLRVKANTLHNSGSVWFYMALKMDATLEKRSASVAATMQERGLGDQWYVEGNPREQVDFEFCYPVVQIPAVPEVEIFLKQQKIRVTTTES
jgi:hypothetical protein